MGGEGTLGDGGQNVHRLVAWNKAMARGVGTEKMGSRREHGVLQARDRPTPSQGTPRTTRQDWLGSSGVHQTRPNHPPA